MKKTYIYLSTIAVLVFQYISWGQQTALFPEYNYNPFIVNAAYAGMGNGLEVTVSNYGYINKISGSPKTFSFSLHGPLAKGKMGLGGAILRDNIGVTNTTYAYAAYSYKIFFDFKEQIRPYWQSYNANVFSFGFTVGLQQYNDDLLDLGITNDPEFAQNISATIPTIGLGFLYNCANFYAGVSAPNVLGDALATRDDLNLSNPVYGYLGYRFYTTRFEELMIKPSFLIKHEKGAPVQFDTNLAVNYKNKLEIGVGYRSSKSVNVLAGIYLINDFKFVYYYNTGFNNALLGNSHGLVLSYVFKSRY